MITGVVRELVSGNKWFGQITCESQETEIVYGAEHTDIVTVAGSTGYKHLPLAFVAIEPCEVCPEDAVEL
jgi:hypothetical protein